LNDRVAARPLGWLMECFAIFDVMFQRAVWLITILHVTINPWKTAILNPDSLNAPRIVIKFPSKSDY
jgi:hypothetical protein